MACFGSKPLRRKTAKSENLDEMNGEYESYLSKRGRKNDKSRNSKKGNLDLGDGDSNRKHGAKRNKHERRNERGKRKNANTQMPEKSNDPSKQQITLRKTVDPETARYFTEIAKLFEGNEVDLEERSSICANALEETRGKEVELATDMIISHTLQTLVEGCDLEQLCGFLQNCAQEFPSIAMDKFGSHVAETSLKSLMKYLHDEGSISLVEDTLTRICQMVALDAVNVMNSLYGSHVLRSLLCLCKGVPVDALEAFHVTKRSAVLAERLNCTPAQLGGHNTMKFQHSFPAVFSFLIREMLKHAKSDIATLRVNKYSSFVLQTALKLLLGDDQELLRAILIILGCEEKNMAEGKFIDAERKHDIIALLEDTSFSHLFEVIIEVAPVILLDEFLNEVFKGSLFEMSSRPCGNFVVQALVASAKTKDQLNLIWEELGSKFEELLEIGKSGVVASILAACQRLQIHAYKCCEALAAAVSSQSESTRCCVPHILFLDSYFRQKSSWMWPVGDKMHTLGCMMLQAIFRCPKQFIQPYVASISSMDADHIFETAKDAGGGRVLESFLCSEVSVKQKFEIITNFTSILAPTLEIYVAVIFARDLPVRLHGHFGELAMHPSSSFTVEKCFAASNVSLKEGIASELLSVQADLSKMKHGPYLLKKLDIDGFARWPEQWKRSQTSKETIFKEFQAAFGSNTQLQEQPKPSQKPSEKRKNKNERTSHEADLGLDVSNSLSSLGSEFPGLDISMAKMGILSDKHGVKRERPAEEKNVKDFCKKKFLRNCPKTTNVPFLRNPGKRKSPGSELADLAGRQKLSSGDVHKLFTSTAVNEMKQFGKEKKPFLKKPRK